MSQFEDFPPPLTKYEQAVEGNYCGPAPRPRSLSRCSDGFCGALDCDRCYPGGMPEDEDDGDAHQEGLEIFFNCGHYLGTYQSERSVVAEIANLLAQSSSTCTQSTLPLKEFGEALLQGYETAVETKETFAAEVHEMSIDVSDVPF